MIRHFRQIQSRRPEDQGQQYRKMRQKTAVPAEAVFTVDPRAVFPALLPAVQGEKPRANRLPLTGAEGEAVRLPHKRRRLRLSAPRDGHDAHHRAQRQVQPQQYQQQLEIPAVEHIVKLQQQDCPMEAAVGLGVPGDGPALGNGRAHHRQGGNKAQQQDAETHGAHYFEYFLHDRSPAV